MKIHLQGHGQFVDHASWSGGVADDDDDIDGDVGGGGDTGRSTPDETIINE